MKTIGDLKKMFQGTPPLTDESKELIDLMNKKIAELNWGWWLASSKVERELEIVFGFGPFYKN